MPERPIPSPHALIAAQEQRQDPSVAKSSGPPVTETRGFRSSQGLHLVPGLRGAPPAAPITPREAYAAMVSELKGKYKIAVRKWRARMSGVAYELKYRDGRIKRLISSPRPRSPVSAAIFLHEVGHHAVGFHRYRPRVLEEYYVWQWTFREMTARNIPITSAVLRHYCRSMYHYTRLQKKKDPAALHGLPRELQQFHTWPG